MIPGISRAGALVVGSVLVSMFGFGLAVLRGDSEEVARIYSILERAYYLTAQDAAWIRPGLNLRVQNVTIPADRKPVVTFRITDDGGQGLDRGGNITPGTVATSFVLAYLPQGAGQYVAYTTRVQTSPITGVAATQAGTDAGGRYASLGDGSYTYTFGTTLPSGYDGSATTTLGIYATRDLTAYGLSRYISNELKDFIPAGGTLTKVRDVVRTASCNSCHDPLSAHGGARQKVELCVLCHTPQTKDPDTGNTVDMKVMTHKIHRGAGLPSVRAGKPYRIIGFGQGVNDYSTVEFPQDIRNCQTCHQDSVQVNNWLLNPSRETCGSCHDDINWETGANHAAGAQADDAKCATCHTPEGEFEYDASIKGAHIAEYRSTQLRNPKFEILGVTNGGAGQKPTVRFKITDKNGAAVAPSAMARLALTVGGPTSDYQWYLQESATAATVADGVASYTFTGMLPANASGTYTAEIEGYLNTTLNPGTKKALVYRDAGPSVTRDFATSGTTVIPRRAVVDLDKCNQCHDNLQLHGNNRNRIEACVLCHNPTVTDSTRRPASAAPNESVDFKTMIHKIHTGEELAYDYTVYAFGSVATNFNEVRFPGDRRDCLACHRTGTYTIPVTEAAKPVTTPRGFWTPTLANAAACLSCHDSLDAAAHAYVNTAAFGESCAVCHREGADHAVSKVHAR
jgi:OmcA/MtrC family decaheme c-type cytochrome